MPTYDFICNNCNQRFDVFLTYSEYGKKTVTCAHCGAVHSWTKADVVLGRPVA